ncbi:PEP-CTERM domain protein [Singulisphaera acidiphila]|uniref:PEP-CTERM motif protein n=1 Tax=Singulisphaera acidiphila (strain ATCC BAA-1392 / DSM 18658 / VKM B-2454 / MOB10) TaxID=886293 RepID=L0DL72_SINAD|nr:PEP-CTERM domain protein [Singulisphaera acidiphila]AGA29598.1 PEP-CTERM motif protein [Singulisphaera acidiphila DSM 18658]
MKKLTLALAAVIGLFVAGRADASLVLGFNSDPNNSARINIEATSTPGGNQARIFFTGGFYIAASDGGVGDAFLKTGYFSGPGFTYTSVQTAALGEKADLTGAGNTLVLSDGAGGTLTATIVGLQIETQGILGHINLTGKVNLSGVTYTGYSGAGNQDFLQLVTEASPPGGGIAGITFSFGAGTTLSKLLDPTQLNGAGQRSRPYTGSLSTVPEPGSMALAFSGVAMLGLGYYRQQRRKSV